MSGSATGDSVPGKGFEAGSGEPSDAALDPLAAEAARLLSPQVQLAPSTLATVEVRAGLWLRFCGVHHLDPLGASDMELACFALDRLQGGVKPASVAGIVSSLVTWRRGHVGADDDWSKLASTVVRMWSRRHGGSTAPERATVYPYWFLLEMAPRSTPATATPTRPHGPAADWRASRDRAILAVGYATLLRPSEIVRIELANVSRQGRRYVVVLHRTKTSVDNARTFTFELQPTGDALCPVAALDDWLARRGPRPGALFIGRKRYSSPIVGGTALKALQALATAAGENPTTLTARSLRRSRATHLRMRGATLEQLARELRHSSSKMSERYVASASPLDETELGLPDHYISSTPPPNPSFKFGQLSSARKFATYVPDPDLAGLVDGVNALLSSPADAHPPTTRQSVDHTWKVWTAWAADNRVAPDRIDPSDLAWFLADRRDTGDGRNRLRTIVHLLALHQRLAGHADPAISTIGLRIVDRLTRDTPRRRTMPTVWSPTDVLAAAEAAATHDQTRLCVAVLRYQAAHRGVWELDGARGRRPWTGTCRLYQQLVTVTADDITFDGDTTTMIRLRRNNRPDIVITVPAVDDWARCPVRALRHLSASRPTGPLVETSVVRAVDGCAVPERWTPAQFAAAVERDAAGVRRAARNRMAICVGYHASLRSHEILNLDMSDLTATDAGYRLRLGSSRTVKFVDLVLTDDASCPVAAIDAFLAVWPHTSGPLVPGDVAAGASKPADQHAPATVPTLNQILHQAAPSGREGDGWEVLRRSCALHLHQAGTDLLKISRRLRHRSSSDTLRFLARFAPEILTPDLSKFGTTPPPAPSAGREAI